jgi:hypothetical protein
MKTIFKLSALILIATGTLGYAGSKRTADYLRLDPTSHLDKEVTLDVSMVKPVHWKSPVEGVAFFHALTVDRTEDKSGGSILVAVPAADAEKFAKKYGTTFESRNDKNRLKGTFILVSGKGASGLWIIDTTGKIAQLIKDGKLDMPADAKGGRDDAPDAGKRRHPLRKR